MPGGFLGKIFSLVVGQSGAKLCLKWPRCLDPLAYHVITSHIASGGAHVRRGLKGSEQVQFITSDSLIEDSEEVK